jgi:hypothetical protein
MTFIGLKGKMYDIKIKNFALELTTMNLSLLKNDGDLSEKSLKNFIAEIKRLSNLILSEAEDEEIG